MGFRRSSSCCLSSYDSGGPSTSSLTGSLADLAQLAYSPAPSSSSASRSSFGSTASAEGSPLRCEGPFAAGAAAAGEAAMGGEAAVSALGRRSASADALQLPPGLAALGSLPASGASSICGSSSVDGYSLFSSAAPALDAFASLGGRAASPDPLLAPASSLRLGPASGSASPDGGGPPPQVLLAVLAASLEARKEQQRQAECLGLGPISATSAGGAAGCGGPRQPAVACSACHMVFADVAAYQAHCASQEHAVNIVHASLAMSLPRVAAAATGGFPARALGGPRTAAVAWPQVPGV